MLKVPLTWPGRSSATSYNPRFLSTLFFSWSLGIQSDNPTINCISLYQKDKEIGYSSFWLPSDDDIQMKFCLYEELNRSCLLLTSFYRGSIEEDRYYSMPLISIHVSQEEIVVLAREIWRNDQGTLEDCFTIERWYPNYFRQQQFTSDQDLSKAKKMF